MLDVALSNASENPSSVLKAALCTCNVSPARAEPFISSISSRGKWVASHHCNLLPSNLNLWKFREQGLPLLHVIRVSINCKDFPVVRGKEICSGANFHKGVERRWQPAQLRMRSYCDTHQCGSRILNDFWALLQYKSHMEREGSPHGVVLGWGSWTASVPIAHVALPTQVKTKLSVVWHTHLPVKL